MSTPKKQRVSRTKAAAIIVRDPGINWSEWRLACNGVSVRVIRDRFLAGESVASIAYDYHTTRSKIEAALRFGLRPKHLRTASLAPYAAAATHRGESVQ